MSAQGGSGEPGTTPDTEATTANAGAAAISDDASVLFIADFDDTDSAWAAYEELKAAQDGVTVKIEGVVVVKREKDGKVEVLKATDHSTKKGFKRGLIGGAVIGLIFPPSILAGAAVMGAIGAASGKARALHQRGQLAEDLETAIYPGHSGVIALVSSASAPRIRAALSTANKIVQSTVDEVVAGEIKAAAKAARREAEAADPGSLPR